MFKIGDKVKFGDKGLVGYIVKIEIMAEFEEDIAWDKKDHICYTIRVFRDFYIGGYTDFVRMERELTHAED